MNIMKFKTNARCEGCVKKIIDNVKDIYPDAKWTLDLESADKVLEVHGIPDDPEMAREVEDAIQETGFKGSFIPAASDY